MAIQKYSPTFRKRLEQTRLSQTSGGVGTTGRTFVASFIEVTPTETPTESLTETPTETPTESLTETPTETPTETETL